MIRSLEPDSLVCTKFPALYIGGRCVFLGTDGDVQAGSTERECSPQMTGGRTQVSNDRSTTCLMGKGVHSGKQSGISTKSDTLIRGKIPDFLPVTVGKLTGQNELQVHCLLRSGSRVRILPGTPLQLRFSLVSPLHRGVSEGREPPTEAAFSIPGGHIRPAACRQE